MKMENGREPDLIFVSNRNLHRLRNTYLDGPADLAVEIMSPESIGRDRGDKFYEYARGGVPEYWLIDPQEQWAEFYHLHSSRYQPAFTGDAGIYHASTIPGFWLKVEWLWQQPLPSVEETLLEIGGESYLLQWIERLRRRGFRIERSS
jgi:Uma2 family endonuclease